MEQLKSVDSARKEIRIQIEAPPVQKVGARDDQVESLPLFYRILLILTFVLSGVSLYWAFVA